MFGSIRKEDDITSSNKIIDCTTTTTTIYKSKCDLLEMFLAAQIHTREKGS